MNSPNFQSILDTPVEQIERPKPLPAGTYMCVVGGQPRFDKSARKQTDFVEFTLNVAQPGPDVDQAALAEAGGAAGKTLRVTFYLTQEAAYRLKEFLGHLGLDDGTKTLREQIAMAPGRQVYANVVHQVVTNDQTGETAIYANVSKTAAI